METVVLTIHLILALLLVGIVLLQRSEGGGLGMGGGGQGAISARGAATAMTKLTWGLAAAFIATSIALTVLAAQKAATESVVDSLSTEAPAAAEETAPALGSDLLPPAPADAPVTPPRADDAAPAAPAAPATNP